MNKWYERVFGLGGIVGCLIGGVIGCSDVPKPPKAPIKIQPPLVIETSVKEIKKPKIEIFKSGYFIRKIDLKADVIEFQYSNRSHSEQLTLRKDIYSASLVDLVDLECDGTVNLIWDKKGMWVRELLDEKPFFSPRDQDSDEQVDFEERFRQADERFGKYKTQLKDLIDKTDKQWRKTYPKK